MLEYLYFLHTEVQSPATTDPARPIAGTAGRGGMTDTERRLGALELAMEALVRLGVDSGAYTEKQFFDVARQIDNEDGVLDGRRDLMRMRKICPTCGKPNSAAKPVCMWCTTSLVDVDAQPTPPGATPI